MADEGCKQQDDDGKASTAKPAEPGCPICLSSIKEKSFVDVCFHTFCFSCIVQWADVVTYCPMCKEPFKSIIHNVRGADSYDQYPVQSKPLINGQEISLSEARRFWLRITKTTVAKRSTSDNKQHRGKSSSPPIKSTPPQREAPGEKRRKAVYAHGLWVKPKPGIQQKVTAVTDRLAPWLRREVKVILGEEQISFMVTMVNSLLNKYDITSAQFTDELKSFFYEHTEQFVHELVNYAQSTASGVAEYDQLAQYGPPGDGSLLPPVDEPVEMMEEDKGYSDDYGSGQDDTRDAMEGATSSQDYDDVRRTSKESTHRHDSSSKTPYSRTSERVHRHGDSSPSHRLLHRHSHHGDERRDKQPYGRGDDRRHSHSSRCRSSSGGRVARDRSLSSPSPRGDRERDRHRRSSSRDRRGHHKTLKKNRKGPAEHRRGSSNGGPVEKKKKKKKKHSKHDSGHRLEREGVLSHSPKNVATASDKELQRELVSLETQITMDKKMLLQNLLRKERLALLHESLEQERSGGAAASDSMLKEELDQLNEAIETGRSALLNISTKQ